MMLCTPTEFFPFRDGQLYCEEVALSAIAAAYGTPAYVYSQAAVTRNFQAYQNAFSATRPLVCYAVKANGNLSLLHYLASLGAGFDIVSAGELTRVLSAGADPRKVIFSGVAKSRADMEMALKAGIGCFNVESVNELARLNDVAAALGTTAPISLRINPDVDARTHPYISTGLKDNKFGIAYAQALNAYRTAQSLPHLRIVGVDCHIGSQLTETAPLTEALGRLLALVDELAAAGIVLEHLDLGGGVGIVYTDETAPDLHAYAQEVARQLQGRALKLVLEPGRSIVGNAGVLLTRVEYLKEGEGKHFAIVDAGMNDLMRPALYGAVHDILPLTRHPENLKRRYDVVGPVCESADFLGKDRLLALCEDDVLAVMSAGAYTAAMASSYNSRLIAPEIWVNGSEVRLIRERQSYAALLADEEACLPKGK